MPSPRYSRRCPLYCIVPPYIFEKMLESKEPSIRDAALKSMNYSSQLRGVRVATAEMGQAASTVGDARRTVFNANHSFFLSDAVLARGEDSAESDDGSVNRLFDGLGVTREFLAKIFGRNSLDGRGGRLDGYVHVGTGWNNATFDGSVMRFGDGDGVRFTDFTLSLDVIAHELGHGVTQHTSDLLYEQQSGALNELFSDVFGSLVKQWYQGESVDRADWLIGREVWTPGSVGDALRSMKDPGKAYVNHPLFGTDPQPAHMNQYVNTTSDNGGVHYNSGIPNKAFYETAMRIGGNAWEFSGKIWYQALQQAPIRSTFQEFANLTYSVARSVGTAHAECVAEGWRVVGITVAGAAQPLMVGAAFSGNGHGSYEALFGEIAQLRRRLEVLEKGPGKKVGAK